MSRNFDTNNNTKSLQKRMNYRRRYETRAYGTQLGYGSPAIRNDNFVESIHYGVIDHNNNSVIPNEQYLVNTTNGVVLDFVADSYSLMRLNWNVAIQKGLVTVEGSEFGTLDMVDSYINPKVKYGAYLGNILRIYNETHIPNLLGIINIASYEDYVKNFFNFILQDRSQAPITMTRWNTSIASTITDTGLAFSYSEIPPDEDQMKIDKIIDHPCFPYFENLCINMGFSISKNRPNVLIYELKSPATESVRYSYGLYNLTNIFNDRFIKTFTIDNDLLYNNINIYYNKFVRKYPTSRVVKVECGKTVSTYINRTTVNFDKRPYTDSQEIDLYCRIRNTEEGKPYSEVKMKNIVRKAKFLLKKVDKQEAMRYINKEFRDQVWNKDYGYHDLKNKMEQKTNETSVVQAGAAPQSSGNSSY